MRKFHLRIKKHSIKSLRILKIENKKGRFLFWNQPFFKILSVYYCAPLPAPWLFTSKLPPLSPLARFTPGVSTPHLVTTLGIPMFGLGGVTNAIACGASAAKQKDINKNNFIKVSPYPN